MLLLRWFQCLEASAIERNKELEKDTALRPFLLLLIGTLSLGCLGCGKSGLGTIPIRGKVTYQGEPLTFGEVLYNPVDETQRRARGIIQSDGTFQLTTLEKDDGALPGEYKISILALAPHPGEPGRTPESETRGEIVQRIKRGYVIPERYVDPETSGLTDTVDKNHSGFKEIVLED